MRSGPYTVIGILPTPAVPDFVDFSFDIPLDLGLRFFRNSNSSTSSWVFVAKDNAFVPYGHQNMAPGTAVALPACSFAHFYDPKFESKAVYERRWHELKIYPGITLRSDTHPAADYTVRRGGQRLRDDTGDCYRYHRR